MGASAASFASPDLSLDATTREGVRVTVRRLKAAGETVPEVLENLTTQSTPIDLAESRAHTLASGRSNWCYWDCETRLWDQHASACAKLPPGKEMAVCARVSSSISLNLALHVLTRPSFPASFSSALRCDTALVVRNRCPSFCRALAYVS